MATSSCIANIVGQRNNPGIVEVNARSGPATDQALVRKVPVGTNGLPVLAMRPDGQGKTSTAGEVFKWYQLQLPDGQVGWVRNDLIELVGDCANVGTTPAAAPAPAAAAPAPAPVAATVVVAPGTPIVTTTVAPSNLKDNDPNCWGIVHMQSGARLRSGPNSSYAEITRLNRNARVMVLDAKPEEGGASQFRWVKVKSDAGEGWMREDMLRYEGNMEQFSLGFRDLYPASMNDRWWVRGFKVPGPNEHWGWDYGAATGEAIFAGPNGGVVVKSVNCTKCRPEAPNFASQGIGLGDGGALADPAWGFGYGHYVIVRYGPELLPESTKNQMAQRGYPGGAVLVMYAHLHTRDVSEGQRLTGGQRIGSCGNTGNSEATHLHLEVRLAKNPNETQWASIKPGLLDPKILFKF